MQRFFIVMSVVVGLILFSSCGSQMERDATKMAERVVELEQVQKRMNNRSNFGGKRMSEQEYDQYAREYIEYANKMLEKYSETREQRQEFSRLVEKKADEMRNK